MPPTFPAPNPAPPFLPLQATSLPSPPFPRASSVTSLLPCPYPPFTSLAVFLSDCTSLLFPSLPPHSPPLPLPSPSLPSLSTFCSFLKPSNSLLLFLSFSSPHSPTAHHLNSTNSGQFTPIPLRYKPGLFSPLLPLGFRIESSQNVLAVHAVAASQIWLLFVCLREENGVMAVELKKCAVVQLVNPVYDVCLGLGCLMLGERGGVRVFQLRAMIKGREGKKGKGLVNGAVDRSADNKNNGKLRTVKVKQNSGECLSFFVSFNDGGSTKSENGKEVPQQLARTILIHPFSKKTVMVLDSTGDLHFFNLPSNSVMGSSSRSIMVPRDSYTARLDVSIKVRLLAILPNFSTKPQIIWVSDGHHLLKMVSASAMESGTTDSDTTERNLKSVEILATETIFTSGKIRDIVPISSTAVLALTQEKIYAYVYKMEFAVSELARGYQLQRLAFRTVDMLSTGWIQYLNAFNGSDRPGSNAKTLQHFKERLQA